MRNLVKNHKVRLGKIRLTFNKLFQHFEPPCTYFTIILTKWLLWLFDHVIFDVLTPSHFTFWHPLFFVNMIPIPIFVTSSFWPPPILFVIKTFWPPPILFVIRIVKPTLPSPSFANPTTVKSTSRRCSTTVRKTPKLKTTKTKPTKTITITSTILMASKLASTITKSIAVTTL